MTVSVVCRSGSGKPNTLLTEIPDLVPGIVNLAKELYFIYHVLCGLRSTPELSVAVCVYLSADNYYIFIFPTKQCLLN